MRIVRFMTAAAALALPLAVPAIAGASLEVPYTNVDYVNANSTHTGTAPFMQAGGHPDILFSTRFCSGNPATPLTVNQCTDEEIKDQIRDFNVQLPPGFYGDPTNVPSCPYPLFLAAACTSESQVGIVDSWAEGNGTTGGRGQNPPSGQTYNNPLWNVAIPGYAPAVLGTTVSPGQPGYPHPVVIKLRTDDDFGIDSITPDVPPGAGSIQVKIEQINIRLFGLGSNGQPFMTTAPSCSATGSNGLWRSTVNSRQNPELTATGSFTRLPTGCANVPFAPSIELTPETTKAGVPSGQQVALNIPDTEPIKSSHLKDIVTELPLGMKVNAAAARNLEGCTPQQMGLIHNNPARFNGEPARCPERSKIGTALVSSQPVDGDPATAGKQPINGSVYFGTPPAPGGATASNPWPLYIVLEGAGLRIKLMGEVTIDPDTGRVTTNFEDNPQVPFTRFELNLRGGDDAVLQNPRECGDFTLNSVWTPWSGGADKTATATITTSGDGSGGACANPRPFTPTIDGEVTNKQAGGFTHSKLTIDRPAGDELIRSLKLSLPAGLVGSLAAAPSCSLGDLDAAKCPSDTRIGRVEAALGEGSQLLRVMGAAYLAEPSVPGDAATVGVVIPGKVGPIDLGDVVVRNRVILRQSDGGLDVISGDLPLALHGIPLPVRQIVIDVNRDGFFRNPTGCEDRELTATFTPASGPDATAKFVDHPDGCDKLPFAPKLHMVALAKGETKRFSHPGLRATVTQQPGESNISFTKVALPQVLRPETVQFNKPGALCQQAQLDAGACPPLSRTGTATAKTPLLPQPLSGPVYLVQRPGNVIPDLAVQLGGMVSLQLSASNRIEGVRTVTRFGNIPDVPVTSFELVIDGGRNGILKNFADLCETNDHADAEFVGHSGTVHRSQPELEIQGCGEQAAGVSISSRKLKVKGGKATLKLRCTGDKDCKGNAALTGGRRRSFEIGAGQTRSLKLNLSRKAKRTLRKKKSVKSKLTVKLAGSATSKRGVTLSR